MIRLLFILALFVGVGWLVQDQLGPLIRVDQARANIVLTSAQPATSATYGVASVPPSVLPDQMRSTVLSGYTDASGLTRRKESAAEAVTIAVTGSRAGFNYLNYVESMVNDQTIVEVRPACPGVS